MKILMLNYGHMLTNPAAPQIGGAARQCLKLSKALMQKNVDVKILTKSLFWSHSVNSNIENVSVVSLNILFPLFNRKGLRRFGIWVFILRALFYLFRHRDDYDVIHAHSALVSGFVAVLAGKLFKKKSIIKVMNSGIRNDIIRFRQDRSLIVSKHMVDYLHNCDCAVTLNSQSRSELIDLGFKPDRIELIPNGVEVDDIGSKSSYNNTNRISVLFVGRLDTAKGVDVLLKAFKILTTELDSTICQLSIVGKGPLKHELEDMNYTLGISHFVKFTGEVPNVLEHMLSADIFVLPSFAEGISNSLLEAMACGVSCIATDIAGNHDLIQNGKNGLLVKVKDELALAQSILELSTNPILRCKLGKAARRTIESKYNIEIICDRYIRMYRRLLNF